MAPKKSVPNEIGRSGTVIYRGRIQSPDPNRDLVGAKGLETYDRMRLGDGTVKGALRAVTLPILSSTLRVDPADKSDEAKQIADWVLAQLNGMTRPFSDFLREALVFLSYGHYVFEKVYEIKEDGTIGLRKLAPRLPSTIWSWETEDEQPGITQLTQDGDKVSIPIEKLIIFVNEKEGDNWEGVSILRNAYKHWYMKENLEKIDAMAHERTGVGIPKAKPTGNPQQRDKDAAIKALKNLRSGEDAYVFEPDGWLIEFMQLSGSQGRSPIDSMQYHRFEILLSVLAAFLSLGSTDSGSRALSTDLSDFFEMSLKFVAETLVCDPINKFLVKQMVDLNFSVTEYPKVRLDGIGKVDFAGIADTLVKMNTTSTYTPRLDVENYLLRAMGVPEAPDDSYYPDPSEEPQVPVMATPDQAGSNPTTEPNAKPKDQQVDKGKVVKASQQAFLDNYIKAEADAIRQALESSKGDA